MAGNFRYESLAYVGLVALWAGSAAADQIVQWRRDPVTLFQEPRSSGPRFTKDAADLPLPMEILSADQTGNYLEISVSGEIYYVRASNVVTESGSEERRRESDGAMKDCTRLGVVSNAPMDAASPC